MGADLDEAKVLRAIKVIYASIGEPNQWDRALGAAADVVGVEFGAAFSPWVSGGVKQYLGTHNYGQGEQVIKDYKAYFHDRDVLIIGAQKEGLLKLGSIIPSIDALPRKELLQSEIYNDSMLPGGIDDAMTAVVSDGSNPDLPLVLFSLYPALGQGAFDRGHKAKLATLIPHLQRAFELEFEVYNARQNAFLAISALDGLNAGLLYLTREGNVRSANTFAEKLIVERDGVSILNGRLMLANKDETAQLEKMIGQTLKTFEVVSVRNDNVLLVTRPSGRLPYQITMTPAPDSRDSQSIFANRHGASILVRIVDPTSKAVANWSALQFHYALTPGETRLAQAFVDQASLSAAADVCRIKIGTARNIIKSLYRKTHTHNQAELMRLLLSVG